MSSTLHIYFEDLKCSVISGHSSNTKICLTNVLSYFEDELSSSDIDLAISIIFNESSGLISFLRSNLKNTKFKDSITVAFHILLLLIEQFKSRLHNHAGEISKISVSCLFGISVASQKALALQVLMALVKHGPFVEIDIPWLVTKLMHLLDVGKPSGIVLEQLYTILGLLAKEYPAVMSHHVSNIQSRFFSTFEFQTTAIVTMNFRAITGAIYGLDHLYYAFAPDPKEDLEICDKLYNCVKTMSDPGDISNRPAFRAALYLISTHAHLMADQMYRDHKYWHTTLLKWLLLPYHDIKAAVAAMQAFHEQIATVILEKKNLAVLTFFITYFKSATQASSTQSHELRLAIRGFGVMAASCRALMSIGDIQDLFIIVVQRSEQIYLLDSNYNCFEYLSDYIYTLSLIIAEMLFVNTQHINSVQKLSVVLIKDFPQLWDSYHKSASKSLLSTFNNISKLEGTFFDEFLEKTIYQGVIWTCSHQVMIDSVLDKDKASKYKRVITYQSYLPLWNELLIYCKNSSNEKLIQAIYNELIKTLIQLINKLDLTTKRKVNKQYKEEVLPLCDPQSGLEATTPKDFQIFINVVDLYKTLIFTNQKWFSTWIPTYCYEVITNSYRNPLVSGFYKLLSYALTISDSLKYFESSENSEKDDSKSCFLLVSSFLQDCLSRLQHYTADLQVSCLQVLIAAPICFVNHLLEGSFSAFQVIFKVGRSYLKLADMGLTALERWNAALPKEHSQKLLKQILPYLDPFLQVVLQSSEIVTSRGCKVT